MKNINHKIFILFYFIFSAKIIAQELTDGPQSLEPATETENSDTKKSDIDELAPSTEVIKSNDVESIAEENPKTKDENSENKIKKKTKVVAEEELMQVSDEFKKKRDNSKAKSVVISETEMFLQEADKYKLPNIFKNLQLNDCIEQGLRKNYDQEINDKKQNLSDLEFKGVKDAFWLPPLKLSLTTANQNISTLRRSSRVPTEPNPTVPTGTLGLSLGDYTVFNWGKDYAVYLNKKSTYERNKNIHQESKREFKQDLIEQFFTLSTKKEIEKIKKDQLRHASFVYRLSKEKITIGKTSKQEYYQARSEYLKAQNDYHQATINVDKADEQLAYTLADELGTKYVLNEALDYKRIKITLEEALDFSRRNNPTILNNKSSIENAERSYEVALKENLPLPKFAVNLGAYNKKFSSSSNRTTYDTYSDSGNIELVASVNATWAITGEDGFLNGDKLAKSHIAKELAYKTLEKNQHYTQSLIRESYKTILTLQNQIMIYEARIPSQQKTFDTILENYLNGKVKFYDVHIALNELISSRVDFENAKLEHLKEKINLAKYAGIEDFPGENFERLALRIKGR